MTQQSPQSVLRRTPVPSCMTVLRRTHARRALALFLLTTCLLAPAQLRQSPSRADSTLSTATREGRLAVFDDVWRTIGERYYDPSLLRGVDWAGQRERLRPLAADAAGTPEFYAVLRRLIVALRDPHTRVFAPEERAEWQRPRYTTVGLTLREAEGQLVVSAVEPDSGAERAGVRPGDLLLAVDGRPAADLLARRAAEGAAPTLTGAARVAAVAHLFDGPADTEVALTFAVRRREERERTVRLRRSVRAREPAFEVRRVEGFRVVHFNLFTQEIAVGLMRALGERGDDRRGLVIDLRDNGGGEAEAMVDIASAFLPAGTALGQFTDRAGHVTSAPQTRRRMLFAADAVASFRGPLVLLTGPRTASAAEIFAAALQEGGRARVVGEQTCGCVLAIRRRHPLPDGGVLDVSEMDYRTARARRLEGAGVTPDETVTPTRRDIEQRRDPALQRALEALRSGSRAGGPFAFNAP